MICECRDVKGIFFIKDSGVLFIEILKDIRKHLT